MIPFYYCHTKCITMKSLLYFIILFAYSVGLFSQTNIPLQVSNSPAGDNNWFNLDEYVWSHTHSKTQKGDKPPLDFNALDNWLSLGEYVAICPNGAYLAYAIQRGQIGYGYPKKLDSIVVQATGNSWRQAFANASPGFFSMDSKQYVLLDKQGLHFLKTGTNESRFVPDIASYKISTGDNNEWLAYLSKNKELVLLNLVTGKEKRITGIIDFEFDPSGKWLAAFSNNTKNPYGAKEMVIYNLRTEKESHFTGITQYEFHSGGHCVVFKTVHAANNETVTALQYVSLVDAATETIWRTTDTSVKINNLCIDGTGSQVAFMVESHTAPFFIPGQANQASAKSLANGEAERAIWHWRIGMGKAGIKADQQMVNVFKNVFISDRPCSFTDNNKYIQFYLKYKSDPRLPGKDAAKVDVWSYKDSMLQTAQLDVAGRSTGYLAVVDIQTAKLLKLEQEFEQLVCLQGDYAVVAKLGREEYGDRFWEKGYKENTNWLVSLRSGERKLLSAAASSISFSPGGQYLVYYDAKQQGNYYSYHLATGRLVNICSGVPAWRLGMSVPYYKVLDKPVRGFGVAEWLPGDSSVLVYDYWDIWQLDLTGKQPAINTTNGYKNKVVFSMMRNQRSDNLKPGVPVFIKKNTILLNAFNTQNKWNGFYQIQLGKSGNPEKLYMGPCLLSRGTFYSNAMDTGMIPIKAAGVDRWIVKRQTATEAPNYFVTGDFKRYEQVTNLQPHAKYNWLTTELHTFKQLDGTLSQGVLFKPENFDATKKYPVLIAVYDQLSHQLYNYEEAGYLISARIPDNPAWMVSHGYLVFLPDIYYTPGQTGPSVMNTVEGAVKYLSRLSFVNGKRIGATGHSHGGFIAYYLLTHSRSFAALSPGAHINNVLSRGFRGAMELKFFEKDYDNSGLGSFFQNKEAWLDHSAALQADKVTSPVLIFHCARDGAFNPGSTIEMYIALRRLQKRAWWLQYDKGHHNLFALSDQRDFTLRYTQFYDHYLKGAPPPKWMTGGVPLACKGIESRFELDMAGRCGVDCVICNAPKNKLK